MEIELQQLTKTYQLSGGRELNVLDNIDLQFGSGDFISVTGPSGSGKTTLLSIIGLLTKTSHGNVFLNGIPSEQMRESERDLLRGKSMGIIFQFPSLHPTLTVLENVLIPCSLYSSVSGAQIKRAMDLLECVCLLDKKDKYSYQISGGEQRRVALVRGLIRNPELIVADEPTGALDDKTAQLIIELLVKLSRTGKAVIVATHDREIVRHANRNLRIKAGKLIGDSAPTAS